MSAFYNLSNTPRNILNQAIVRAIVSENDGAWFDPSDLSTLYQDAAGTTPVTAVEQPVGKIIDKSGNGNHATQSVTASRPVLSARYNLLTKTEDFSDAVWIKNYCTVTTNTTADPFGGTRASTITSSSSTINPVIYQVAPAMISGATYTVSRYVKAGSVTKCTLGLHKLTDIYFDLNELTYNAIGTGFVSASIVDVGSGWRKITGSWVWSGTTYQVYFSMASTMSSQIGVPVGGYLYSFGHSLVLGPTSGPYQRVNTATDYDTDPRYFPKYLRFDGVDDYLTLGDVFDIGINGVSINTSVILFESTKSPIAGKSLALATGGRYFLGTEPGTFLLASHDIAPPVNIAYSQSIGESVVLSAKLGPHGNRSLSLYKNANLLSTVNTSLTTASYDTTYPFWIGAYPNSTGTTPAYAYLKGGIYGLIVTQSALTDAQRIACERYLGRKSGVQL